VTDDHDVVTGGIEFTPCFESDGDVGEGLAGFESEFGDKSGGLFDEGGVG